MIIGDCQIRIANVNGRLAVAVGDGWVDVEKASGGTFSADTQAIYDRWDAFTAWAKSIPADAAVNI